MYATADTAAAERKTIGGDTHTAGAAIAAPSQMLGLGSNQCKMLPQVRRCSVAKWR